MERINKTKLDEIIAWCKMHPVVPVFPDMEDEWDPKVFIETPPEFVFTTKNGNVSLSELIVKLDTFNANASLVMVLNTILIILAIGILVRLMEL
jgi:hypothetical protein